MEVIVGEWSPGSLAVHLLTSAGLGTNAFRVQTLAVPRRNASRALRYSETLCPAGGDKLSTIVYVNNRKGLKFASSNKTLKPSKELELLRAKSKYS